MRRRRASDQQVEKACWRRALLKKYVQDTVHRVTDEDDEVDEKKDVSPVVQLKTRAETAS
ncbi:hypothetical protein F4824DRAFT_493528 [Ustulina deusta]|nr:hypothetical protein F4824DRAFT_493528 [Ustulina deusta]